jgi:hypothetical protein
MSESTGKSKSRSHSRRAADEFQKAAEAFAEHALPPEAMSHLREAARHLLRAGISALDEADRRARERGKRDA